MEPYRLDMRKEAVHTASRGLEDVSIRIMTMAGENLTLDFEKCRQQLELVFLGRDGIGQLLAVVERLQQGLEAIVYQRHLGRHRKEIMDWRNREAASL